ncbi:MAG: ABC transporter ATP-binding protein [SAR202 cluster bacterium]|jgi:putative ABC transport system ATP-binding protein|nr:macrolide ABC transporter ATP-binding protein [Chloroflexota bacterium]MCL0030436.1 ABC transporter ATP-binding protein [Dehalococcoidia bacterium]MDP7231840.1 ABC transporter ATP-binding protein [Dehalococcoidia bacterium]MDP7613585.1 ABC transporter ATP-binding protein [Dehalococcoidia bacterium]MQG47270.1 ABC transporter ATP-binding protein [SAR202 cluster bacterium]|tara:strand:- start:2923 stop:3612 length:690 start_codon:yes stop_codon:yes gene_type:complete
MNKNISVPYIIQALDLSRNYELRGETINALSGIDLSVSTGEFVTFVGRSGSGKTTLLNLLAGLDLPTRGQVLFNGSDMAKLSEEEKLELRRKKIGIIFQSFSLLPLLSAYENVELPLRIAGVNAHNREQMTMEAMDIVQLSHRSKHRPYELSGGEQQRIAIARAIATKPDVILADEPTGELDSTNAENIFGLFKLMVERDGMSILATTHDRALLDLSHKVYQISNGKLV